MANKQEKKDKFKDVKQRIVKQAIEMKAVNNPTPFYAPRQNKVVLAKDALEAQSKLNETE